MMKRAHDRRVMADDCPPDEHGACAELRRDYCRAANIGTCVGWNRPGPTDQVRHRLCPGSPWDGRYSHLSLEERCRPPGIMEMSLSISEVARRIGRTGARSPGARAQPWRRRLPAGRRPAPRVELRGSKIARFARPRGHVEDRPARGWSRSRSRADGAGGVRVRDQRGVHLPSCVQSRRKACGPAAIAGAAQTEPRPAAARRTTRADRPEPHVDPSRRTKAAPSHPVRPLAT